MSRQMRWWEDYQPDFDNFFCKAKESGQATCSEINDVLPDKPIDGAEIEELLAFLDESGIRIIADPQN